VSDRRTKVVFLPPGYEGKCAAGYRAESSSSNTMLVGIRTLPVNGDVPGAIARIKTVTTYEIEGLYSPGLEIPKII
jgi:hypothetical protein